MTRNTMGDSCKSVSLETSKRKSSSHTGSSVFFAICVSTSRPAHLTSTKASVSLLDLSITGKLRPCTTLILIVAGIGSSPGMQKSQRSIPGPELGLNPDGQKTLV